MEYKLSGKVSLDDYIQFNKNHRRHGLSLIIRLVVYPLLVIFTIASIMPDLEYFKGLLSFYPLKLLEIF